MKGLKANNHQTRVQMENTSVNVTVYGLWKYKIFVTISTLPEIRGGEKTQTLRANNHLTHVQMEYTSVKVIAF